MCAKESRVFFVSFKVSSMVIGSTWPSFMLLHNCFFVCFR
jgi:hypothetical protein